MKRLILLALLAGLTVAEADPQLTSWFTANSGQYARIYASAADETAGTKSVTWSRGTTSQASPAYSDVSEIASSTSWIYIRTTGLASHMMGPWPANFPGFPSNTATGTTPVYRIPRVPALPATKQKTGLGVIGRFVNGVSFFDNRDAFSYVNATNTEANPGDTIWSRDAYVNESATFDKALAHQAGNNYHYHVHPVALRWQLGDHVNYTASTNTYTEAATVPAHSPIVAWAADGFPVYGPYGYSDPTNAASGVRRMVSGYVLRNGSNNTVNLTTAGRHLLPAWAAAAQNNRSTTLATTEYGPDVSASFPLGRYIEDNDYRGDLGFTQTTGNTARDFDLDQYNGRMCVTPDFPTLHYCYFTTINADGTPAYPYNIGRQYYGNPTGGAVSVATMTADAGYAQYFIGGANTPVAIGTPNVSGATVTLTWSAVEGGTYSVDASSVSNFSTYTNRPPDVVASAKSASKTYVTLASSGTEYGRVSRTALATYDSAGQTAATVAQSATTSYSPAAANPPPTINSTTLNPIAPTSGDNVIVTANVTPAPSTTISSVQLTYDTGGVTTNTVLTETMGAAAGAWTTANNQGANNAWTVNFAAGPPNPFSQTIAANHGTGNADGMEINRGTPNLTDNYITTTNPINASGGTAAYVEFYVATANLVVGSGWTMQLSPDGSAGSYVTRMSEISTVAGTGHIYPALAYHYDLAPNERVSTLKMRFQFAGAGPANPASKMSLDDIKVVTTAGAAPVTIPMTATGGGNYTATIPLQPANTVVNYSVLATDSIGGTASVTSNYTVAAAAPSLTVTPTGGFSSSGVAGSSNYSPSSANYTVTNSGTGSMNWTAGKAANWLNLSSTSGTLATGASTIVIASINNTSANPLTAATYNDTITFTNTSNHTGDTTRAATLVVSTNTPPVPPTLGVLASFSQGSAKTISWSAVAGATSYTLEISTSATFATVLGSQTVTSLSAAFANLANGVTYYYRLRANNSIGASGNSNIVSSTQDSDGPVVAITLPASGTSTAANAITFSGTSSDALSGIGKVTVNGVTATTSNGFANWTLSVPLGFGTNSITALAIDNAGNTTSSTAVLVTVTAAQTYNPLVIPDTITGTTFNLTLGPKTKQFLTGAATNTNAYNNMLYGAPTLIMNKGDWVQMNVTNNLAVDTTTTHWHGFHIPAIMDGGPHQTIPAGTTWSPSWTVMNNAGTYWYHPHLHQKTQEQVSRGAVGMIIIRDPQEAALTLPRTYGVDDIPLALGSRRFTANQIVTTNSAYGDTMLVNGVINPQVSLPKQYVRLRILNAEIERSLNLGFSDNRIFWVIASDGGLLNAPVETTRLLMGVGERYEILVDLSSDTASIDLMAYNSNTSLGTPLANAFPGGETQTTGQFGSLLNNADFNVLHINIAATTANPVTTRPATLATNTYWTTNDVTNPTTRTLNITGGAPGLFYFNTDQIYTPTVFNQTVTFNAVERWTITNTSGFSHSFHIHDIQFDLISRVSAGAGNAVFTGISTYEQGWKDTVYVQRNSSVTFLARFDQFASNTNPFMYHCHFANHEDEGLMGQFIVVNNAVEGLAVASFTRLGNNSLITLQFKATPGTTYTLQYSPDLTTNSWTDIGSVTSDGSSATFTETDPARLAQAKGYYRVKIPVIQN